MNEYLKVFARPQSTCPFYISLAGVTYPDAAYHITRNSAEVTVIEYVVSGQGYVCCDGKAHCVGRDTVYLLRQGERHDYYADADDPFRKIFMNVSGTSAERLITEYGIRNRRFFDGDGLKPLFERIPELTDSDMPDSRIQSALQGVFTEILSRLSLSGAEEVFGDEALALRNHIDCNLGHIVSADELSRVIFRSPDYCLKLFRREFGVTPYAYQIGIKMQMAKSLLINTNMSVGQIAESLGYSDLHYFSNLFKEKNGCRPLSYRKNN